MPFLKVIQIAWIVMVPAFAFQDLDIQEMGGDRIVASCTNQNLVLFRLVQPPADELYLFNFGTRKFKKISDARIKNSNLCIGQWKDGFALFSKPFFAEGSIFILNASGSLEKSIRFEQIKGWNSAYDTLHFCSRPDSKVLVSYQLGADWTIGYLGLLDLDQLKFEELISIPNSANDLSSVWVCSAKKTFILSPYSGKIRQANDTYQPSVLLRKGEAFRETKKQNTGSKNMPLFLRYAPIFGATIAHHDFVEVLHMRTTDEKVKKMFMGKELLVNKLIVTPLSISDKEVETLPSLIVGVFKDQVLSFVEETGSFQIQP